MWFDGQRQPNTLYVANISRGKDSTAMLRAIQLLGFPLDAIVAVDVWATKDIPAELPPMVAFKDEYDKKVLENFDIPVTRLSALKPRSQNIQVERERERERDDKDNILTYEDIFYRTITPRNMSQHTHTHTHTPRIYGFPQVKGIWCNSYLKMQALQNLEGLCMGSRQETQTGATHTLKPECSTARF